jgi:hypothetical protein
MKTKTMLGIASLMVFGAALFLGIAVLVIFMLARGGDNSPEASVADNSEVINVAPDEEVMLFENVNSEAIRINLSTGSSQSIDLGLAENNIYLSGRTVSNDGRLLAYCAVERDANGVDVTSRFAVRDLETGTNLIEQNFGNIPACNPGAFSPDSTKVAVGFVFNSAFTGENSFPNEPAWALRVFDVQSGALVHEFSANSPNAPDFGAMEEYWFEPGMSPMPDVVDYSVTRIIFVAYPFVGRDGPPAVPAFAWYLPNNELRPVEGLENVGSTYLSATEEVAYPFLNEAFPAAQPMGPIPLANEIRIQDASGTRTIYRDSENVVTNLRFVNGGRQIAAMLIPGGDPNGQMEPMPARYILINRDGTVENLNSASPNFVQLFPTNNGFGVLKIEQQQLPENRFVNFHQILTYTNGNLVEVWELTPEAIPPEQGQIYMELLWSSPQNAAPNLSPFTELN